MSVRRFVGANSRDVMRQVREVLGDDALIVANRRTEGGVEILAMADDAVDQFDRRRRRQRRSRRLAPRQRLSFHCQSNQTP